MRISRILINLFNLEMKYKNTTTIKIKLNISTKSLKINIFSCLRIIFTKLLDKTMENNPLFILTLLPNPKYLIYKLVSNAKALKT